MRIVHEGLKPLLFQRAIKERQAGRNRVIKNNAPDGGGNHSLNVFLHSRTQNVLWVVLLSEVDQITLNSQLDWRLRGNFFRVQSQEHFLKRREDTAFALAPDLSRVK